MKKNTIYRIVAGTLIVAAAIFTYFLDHEAKYAQREVNPEIKTNVEILNWGKWWPFEMKICSGGNKCRVVTTTAYILMGNNTEVTNSNIEKFGKYFDDKQPKLFRIIPEDSVLCDSLESMFNQALEKGDTLVLLGIGVYDDEKNKFLSFDIENMSISQVELKHAKKWMPVRHEHSIHRP